MSPTEEPPPPLPPEKLEVGVEEELLEGRHVNNEMVLRRNRCDARGKESESSDRFYDTTLYGPRVRETSPCETQ
ncbi:hypothetical protein KFK09_001382 [Dendrobium nobile]|uniref:Uncharacterized protein n=1 Tax=Dendrobium nobile TaxID=94219 RepID=A0A8T3C9F1_DENNO|nr:hypothetical protein KFK09_001382 [Dendrobium nobile]